MSVARPCQRHLENHIVKSISCGRRESYGQISDMNVQGTGKHRDSESYVTAGSAARTIRHQADSKVSRDHAADAFQTTAAIPFQRVCLRTLDRLPD